MDIESHWQKAKIDQPVPASLTEAHLHTIIAARVRKEFTTVSEFIWAAIVYQIIIYSFLAHTLVRNWGNLYIAGLCLAAAALYAPVTIALIRRTKTLYGAIQDSNSRTATVKANVEFHYARLADFFRFKQRMDWIGVPVSCAIIVLVTFTLFVPGSITGHPLAALVVFVLWVGMSLMAIRSENAKRFVAPLRQLETLLSELNGPVPVKD